jgi:hypothetical protein
MHLRNHDNGAPGVGARRRRRRRRTLLARTARTPSSVTFQHGVRSRDVSAGRLLHTARIHSSVISCLGKHRVMNCTDTTAGKRRSSMPKASSFIPQLNTSRVTSASCTAYHPAHTCRTTALALEKPNRSSRG